MLSCLGRGGLPTGPVLVGALVLGMTTLGAARPLDGARGRPFDHAHGRPFDRAHGTPFDRAHGTQAATPTAKDVIARHVAAIGGEKAFKAVKSVRARGTFSMVAQGVSGEFEMSAARPNKMLIKVNVPGIGQIESGYDGKVGWTMDPVSGPTVLKGRQLSESADDAYFDATLFGPDHVKEMAVVGTETFDGRKATKVRIVTLSGTEQMEYFDAGTGLQIGSESSRETPMGITPSTSVLRDYRKVGGLMMAHVMVQRTMGIEQTLTITGYELDVVPATAFDLPVQIKALIK